MTRGDYSRIRTTIDELNDEAKKVLIKEGGEPDTPAEEAYVDVDFYPDFAPWMDLPDPDGFARMSKRLTAILKRLNVGRSVDVGNNEDDTDSNQGDRIAGNDRLQRVQENTESFANWNGATIASFKDYFINNFDDRVDALFFAAYDLKAACDVLEVTWREAQAHVAGVAEKARDECIELQDGTGSALLVVGLIGEAAGIASHFPAIGTGASLVSAGAGLAGKLPGADPSEVDFSITDLFHIGDLIRDGLEKISSQIKTAESAVDDLLTADSSDMGLKAKRYHLPAARGFLSEKDSQDLVPDVDRYDAREIVAQPPRMRAYADDMDDAADVLRKASELTDELGAMSTYDQWSRGSGIGLEPAGACYSFQAVVDKLSEYALETSQNTSDAAQHLRLCARLYVETDDAVMGDMRDHRDRIQEREDREYVPPQGGIKPGPQTVM